VNAPQALLAWNEKFAPTRFPDWAVPALISDTPSDWKRFFENQQRSNPSTKLLAKSADDAASRGVTFLSKDWSIAEKTLRELREKHGPWLILQEFDRALVSEGETRVFVLNGEVVGSLKKRPHPDRLIMSLDAPENQQPRLELCALTREQGERARRIARTLLNDGVYLSTIDFIGDRVLEINVTSPGLIKWFDEQTQTRNDSLARRYWRGLDEDRSGPRFSAPSSDALQ
jgi:glutathione synthase